MKGGVETTPIGMRRRRSDIIHAVVEDLTPEHAEGYLAAASVVEALDLAR